MSTTTIRLPEELKARVASAARKAGTTAHGFILEAIADKADQFERQAGFHAQAEQRFAEVAESGKTLAWGDVRRYLQGKASGGTPSRPKGRKLA